MATKKKNNGLEMVPMKSGAGLGNPAVAALTTTDLPKGLKKLTLPPMLSPEQIPVNAVVSGKIIALANSISGRADMKESKLIHLQHETGQEFLLPMTGVIKKAIGGNEGVTANIGKTLFVKRTPDGETVKYGKPGDAPKKVFMFDVYISD
jgi:hypothetical protein